LQDFDFTGRVTMNNQRHHWNAIRRRELNRAGASEPTPFARECASLIPPASSILELGCGWGQDAAFFAGQGHSVSATDFSEVVIERSRGYNGNVPNLRFLVMDTAQEFPFADGSFDVVYAHQSLHYFPDDVTRHVLREIHRVLRRDGLLLFSCKSVHDPLYGRGRLIEPDMFEYEGHVRHFFSEEYARSCLGTDFAVLHIRSRDDRSEKRSSSYVSVCARSI
jgi:SAM-dependent methyltransferase